MSPRDTLLADIVALSPSSLERWNRCRREYRSRDLLGLPESNPGPPADMGNLVHSLLRMIHEQGTCRDDAFVTDVLARHGVDGVGPVSGFIARHRVRCPADASRSRHELELARFHRAPAPMFMATGRLDAVWIHDGLLDVRDYKTGGSFFERVADDPRARLQAWLAAPIAARNALGVRVRYEHLAAEIDDDPDPFEPDADELDTIGEELRMVVAQIRAEPTFAGAADTAVCARCRYRGVCPDSATPAEPAWPTPPDEC
ncbi:MAG TPA: PD-(D/E)XK nuclease family protein [Acidimicrobiia bacterium]|nr:PD-(D/E)XK nuclease family protein [Acidimicrobiia bacterium]